MGHGNRRRIRQGRAAESRPSTLSAHSLQATATGRNAPERSLPSPRPRLSLKGGNSTPSVEATVNGEAAPNAPMEIQREHLARL
jgi:hypothetical protein